MAHSQLRHDRASSPERERSELVPKLAVDVVADDDNDDDDGAFDAFSTVVAVDAGGGASGVEAD